MRRRNNKVNKTIKVAMKEKGSNEREEIQDTKNQIGSEGKKNG